MLVCDNCFPKKKTTFLFLTHEYLCSKGSLTYKYWTMQLQMRSRFTKHRSHRCYFLSSVVLCNVSILYCLNEIVDSCPSTSLACIALYVGPSGTGSSVVFACHLPAYPHIGQSDMSSVSPASVSGHDYRWNSQQLMMVALHMAVPRCCSLGACRWLACAKDPLCHNKPWEGDVPNCLNG